MKKISFKSIKNFVNADSHITTIDGIIGNIKQAVFNATVNEVKIYEKDDFILAYLNVSDETGNMNAVLVSNRDETIKGLVNSIKKGNTYLLAGMVSTDIDNVQQGLKDMIGKDIELINNRILFITGIQENK